MQLNNQTRAPVMIAAKHGYVMITGPFACKEQDYVDRARFSDRDMVFEAVGKKLLQPTDHFNQYELTERGREAAADVRLRLFAGEVDLILHLPRDGAWSRDLSGHRASIATLTNFDSELINYQRDVEGPRGGLYDRAQLTRLGVDAAMALTP